MYEFDNANIDDMGVHVECIAHDLHDFFNVGVANRRRKKDAQHCHEK